MDVKSFIKAARLRTLPLSISGIIVGSFLGIKVLNDWARHEPWPGPWHGGLPDCAARLRT